MSMHGPERSGTTPPGDAPRRAPKDIPMDTAMDAPPDDDIHSSVGAYALGVLEADEMTAFEVHLADCEWCAEQLDDLVGMGPLLANLSDLPAAVDTARSAAGSRDISAELTARPSRRLAERLLAEVSKNRTRRRRRARYLVVAAAALIIAGPLSTLALDTGGAPTAKPAGGYSTSLQRMSERVRATDPATKVSAVIGMTKRPWGTDTILELRNVKGPLTCALIAVGKDGNRESASTWVIPADGYGLPDSPNKDARQPLYVWGGTALQRSDIDHFEVITSEGKSLVKVGAQHSV